MKRTITFLAVALILALGAVLYALVSRSAYGAAALALGFAIGLIVGRRMAALESDLPAVGRVKRWAVWALVALGFFLVPRLDPPSAVAAYIGLAFVYAALAGQYVRLASGGPRHAPRPVFGAPLRDASSAHELFR